MLYTVHALYQLVSVPSILAPTVCTYNNINHTSGDVFLSNDGCNICVCIHGNVQCTDVVCVDRGTLDIL